MNLYRVTVDGGAQVARPTSFDKTVALLAEDTQLGRRHVRSTEHPHLVVTLDRQRATFVVFLHGARLDPHDWPSWAKELNTRLGFPDQGASPHDQDPGAD